MKRIVLIDGNNLMYRAYYATMYSGINMKSNLGIPTSAIYAFLNMLNKLINEEKPKYLMVAFDKGKTFRHELYADYKGGRIQTPDDLKEQFPIVKKILNLMGIVCLEDELYEADDIIGTYTNMINNSNEYSGLIVSSDKDLLQLVSSNNDMKLLKQTGHLSININNFKETFGVEPVNITDLKALMGDSSDNIPGVKGIGEKTALKLLSEYTTIENLYLNIDKIKGANQTKLINDKANAYLSKKLATIKSDVPLELTLEDLIYNNTTSDELMDLYKELNFTSFLKGVNTTKEKEVINYKVINNMKDLILDDVYSIYLELDNVNYHNASIIGVSLYSSNYAYYIPYDILKTNVNILNKGIKYTYDYKRMLVSLYKNNIDIPNVEFDTMLVASLLEYNQKEDISYIASNMGYTILENKLVTKEEFINNSIKKAKFIYETKNKLELELKESKQDELYSEIEFKLSKVLANMEYTGVKVERKTLDIIAGKLEEQLQVLKQNIYLLAGIEFNISSPKQLGKVLFEDLAIPYAKKNTTSYSTNVEVLEKLKDKHDIIPLILEYRTISKVLSTYALGLVNYIKEDNKIHTIYTQNVTRTGRLSSIEPNLQNIPTRNIIGKSIRRAFVSNNGVLISADYSQIELRILAHLSNVGDLINIFNNYEDIHSMTAAKVFNVDVKDLTKEQRRRAKVINFGILYGMSVYGLSEELNVSNYEAKEFIEAYYDSFKGVKEYMDNLVVSATKKGYSTTLFGRIRHISQLVNTNYMIKEQGKRIALNTPIQGTSADIMKLAMIRVYDRLEHENLKSKLVMQVHDELIVDTFKEEESFVRKILQEEMENVYELKIPLVVDINQASNWFDMK